VHGVDYHYWHHVVGDLLTWSLVVKKGSIPRSFRDGPAFFLINLHKTLLYVLIIVARISGLPRLFRLHSLNY